MTIIIIIIIIITCVTLYNVVLTVSAMVFASVCTGTSQTGRQYLRHHCYPSQAYASAKQTYPLAIRPLVVVQIVPRLRLHNNYLELTCDLSLNVVTRSYNLPTPSSTNQPLHHHHYSIVTDDWPVAVGEVDWFVEESVSDFGCSSEIKIISWISVAVSTKAFRWRTDGRGNRKQRQGEETRSRGVTCHQDDHMRPTWHHQLNHHTIKKQNSRCVNTGRHLDMYSVNDRSHATHTPVNDVASVLSENNFRLSVTG